MNRIKRTREIAGLSIGQAARLLGWASGPLYAMEIGAGYPPTDEDFVALAQFYNCSVAWLRGEAAVLSAENEALLRDIGHTSDRATVREFMEMLSVSDPGQPASPSVAERLARVAAKRAAASGSAAVPVSTKRRYVQRQTQTRDHHCHWPGCTTQVPPATWGCRTHWFALPKVLRDRVWRTYAPGQEVDMSPSAEYLQVADDVQQWIRDHLASKAAK